MVKNSELCGCCMIDSVHVVFDIKWVFTKKQDQVVIKKINHNKKKVQVDLFFV